MCHHRGKKFPGLTGGAFSRAQDSGFIIGNRSLNSTFGYHSGITTCSMIALSSVIN